MLGLYIHIPFCKHHCHYCDFVKTVPRNQKVVDNYINKLVEEINSYKNYFDKIDTVFIGGGTPNFISDDSLIQVLEALKPIKTKEFTIEINPESYTEKQGQIFVKYGINRVSIGVQTFNEERLKFLNRAHTNKDVINAISSLKILGIENISIDLIFAIPGLQLSDIEHDLNEAIKLDIKHMSYYSLILEENTYFHYLYNRGLFSEVSEDLSGEMLENIIRKLEENGFEYYEISNFSKPGFRSIHNQIYWKFDDYIGVGLGAHGKLDGVRYYNERALNKYLKNTLYEKVELSTDDMISEEMIMGLRLISGINISNVESKYNINLHQKFPQIKEMIDLKLLTEESGYLKLTKKGLFLGNQFFQIFIWFTHLEALNII